MSSNNKLITFNQLTETVEAIKTYVDSNSSTEEVTVSTSGAVSQQLDPGKIYHFTSSSITSLTLSFNVIEGELAQYHFDVISSSTPTDLILPNSVKIDLDGTAASTTTTYTLDASTRYEIDILNNYGVVSQWEIS